MTYAVVLVVLERLFEIDKVGPSYLFASCHEYLCPSASYRSSGSRASMSFGTLAKTLVQAGWIARWRGEDLVPTSWAREPSRCIAYNLWHGNVEPEK